MQCIRNKIGTVLVLHYGEEQLTVDDTFG